jgi:hypothetical protein
MDDLKKLKLIYEDMEGRPMAQYGNNDGPSQPSHVIGTEPLTQRQVQLPKDANERSEKDDEDQEGESSFKKILDGINQTIRKYEQRKKARFDYSLDEVEDELHENTIIQEFVGDFIGGFSKGIGAGSYGSGVNFAKELGGYTKSLKDKAEKERGKNKNNLKIIGENNIKPEVGEYVHPFINGSLREEIIGKVTDVDGKKYKVYLVGLREITEAEKSKKLFGAYSPIEINSEYGFSKKTEKSVEVSNIKIVIVNKAILAKSKPSVIKTYGKVTQEETFLVGTNTIKWAIFNPMDEDQVGSKNKPNVGDKFTYNGVEYIAGGLGQWCIQTTTGGVGKALTNGTTPTKTEVMNAWLSTKP